MVQPPDPYQNRGFGGQDPWGQPGQPQPTGPAADPWGQPNQGGWGPPQPEPPAWSPQPDQGYPPPQQDPGYGPPTSWSPPVSAAPTSGWPGQPGYPPPPPPKSNTGVIVGVISAVVVVLLVLVVGGILLLGGDDKKDPVANPPASSSPGASDSPTPSPTPSTKDPASLDSEDTDETSLTTRSIFPDSSFEGDNGETYTLAGTLKTDACSGIGSGKAKSVMKKHGCADMLVGVWLNEDEDLFSALLIVPLESDDAAEALYDDILASKQKVIDTLTYYCPSDGNPGAKLCSRSSDNLPTWYASFTSFHRYVFIAISLYTDGHRTSDVSEVDDFTTETVSYIQNVLLDNE